LEFIGPGDVLVCVKLDRLGRSTRDVLNLVHELDQKGAFLRILEPAISTDGPMGKMVLTVLGMVAEMELGFIKARQRDGIERAKTKGDVYKGRKPTIDRSAVRDLFNEAIPEPGSMTIRKRAPYKPMAERISQFATARLVREQSPGFRRLCALSRRFDETKKD
jgi:DNA invertase Pin-like site-specific DNA recombinase